MKRIAYALVVHWHKKYHAHSRYWYFFYAQFLIFNITETVILLSAAAVIGIFKNVLLALIGFFLVRIVHGKNHLRSYAKCIIFSTMHLLLIGAVSRLDCALLFGVAFGFFIDTRPGTVYLKLFGQIKT